ncbi:uncharacterized protein BP5553_08120 [Venustampulla echinocandica]|uniref:RRM domain-containing protein n=1 Tax=Venustampulla echinocandica TaxID=2656787 RepID=A0A370TFS7_9HELO|nr:uncharacterized protein BP5553_08120 [Venustampulla echinocandica]RDL33752.1 hypothetical protein BP5553_08120 [Venustampulla echinocandica]
MQSPAAENMALHVYRATNNAEYQRLFDQTRRSKLEIIQKEIKQINENGARSKWLEGKTLQENIEERRKIIDIIDKLIDVGSYPAGGRLNKIFPGLLPDPGPSKYWNFSSDQPLQWSSPLVPGTSRGYTHMPTTTETLTTKAILATDGNVAAVPVETRSVHGFIPTSQTRQASSQSIELYSMPNHGVNTLQNRVRAAPQNVPQTRSPMDSMPFRKFQPSKQLLNKPRQTIPEIIYRAQHAGVGIGATKYRGDLDGYTLENAQTPEHLNCAVFIKGIPPQVTDGEIFATITEGKVFSYFKKPQYGRYTTCAATITFMDRDSAERYMKKCQRPNGMVIGGQRVHVVWSFHPVGPVVCSEMHQSRVLRVKGPEDSIDVAVIEKFLHQYVVFKLVNRCEFINSRGEKTAELAFCSIRGQSRLAMKCLAEEIQVRGWNVTVQYGPDPCDADRHILANASSFPNRSI